MKTSDLRIALFSGNYNYVRDGANQALNRLVEYLLRTGAQVRVYAPTTDTPAFEPTGDLISLPSMPIPGRPEYRLSGGVNSRIKRVQPQRGPRFCARHQRPPRCHLGAQAQPAGAGIGPHPV